MQKLLLFHGKNGSTNAPQFYVIILCRCCCVTSGEGNVLAGEVRTVRKKRNVDVLGCLKGKLQLLISSDAMMMSTDRR